MAEEYTRQSLDIIEHNNLLEPDELGALENIRADLEQQIDDINNKTFSITNY